MRLSICLSFLLLGVWSVAASNPSKVHINIIARQDSASATKSQTRTATKTHESATATATKARKKKPSGLTKAAKIGIGVGVPLGVIAIAGTIGAYIIGRRRGRKRRVDDPTAGAGKLIKDPSPELSIPPPTPAVAELPTVQSDDFAGRQMNNSTWWNPFARSESTKKNTYTVPPNAPQSPQEMPA